jgi:hypothetical protein
VPFILLSFCDTILVRFLFFLYFYFEFGSQNFRYCTHILCTLTYFLQKNWTLINLYFTNWYHSSLLSTGSLDIFPSVCPHCARLAAGSFIFVKQGSSWFLYVYGGKSLGWCVSYGFRISISWLVCVWVARPDTISSVAHGVHLIQLISGPAAGRSCPLSGASTSWFLLHWDFSTHARKETASCQTSNEEVAKKKSRNSDGRVLRSTNDLFGGS